VGEKAWVERKEGSCPEQPRKFRRNGGGKEKTKGSIGEDALACTAGYTVKTQKKEEREWDSAGRWKIFQTTRKRPTPKRTQGIAS